ncbi:MFS transporter [Saccharopolyspora sp. NPDC049426]|uniref:MFS transporter n=1 Tax=Saccharopolyspora sp. NPDC049426 TaxID=3155652 RepID=UPI003445F231
MPSDVHNASQLVVDPPRSGMKVFAAGALALAALYVGNNLPSALYGVFREDFGFSSLTQTLLYATAVAVILPGLLVFGPLSDVVGRRLPMVLGLLVFAAGDVLFVVADDVGWLFAARVAQGLGMGTATAAAQAVLSDSVGGFVRDPVRAQRLAAAVATACITFGLALGPLLGGVLGAFGPAPRQLAFIVHLGLVVLAAALALRAPGRAQAEGGRWRPARITIPPVVRRTFTIAASSSFLAWAVLGMFSAVLPSLVGDLLGTRNLALTASALTLMIGTSGVVQLVARRLAPLTAQAWGLGALALGLALLVAAGSAGSELLTVLAMLSTGAGHGLVYSGALHEIMVVTPSADRGSVVGAYFIVSYTGLGGPVVGVGLLAVSLGLESATRVVALVIMALCVVLIPSVLNEIRRRARSAVTESWV